MIVNFLLILKITGKHQELLGKYVLNCFCERDVIPEVDFDNLAIQHYPEMIPCDTQGPRDDRGALSFIQPITFTAYSYNELLAEAGPDRKFRRFYLIGQVIYDDFFGMRYTRRFCIKLRLIRNGNMF